MERRRPRGGPPVQGLAGAIVAPTCLALVATTFPKGRARNAAVAVFGVMAGIGVVMVWWRAGAGRGLVAAEFLVDADRPGVIYLARTMLQETQRERLRLDAPGAVLATLFCTAAAFGFSVGPERGWSSVLTIGLGLVP